MTNDFVHKITGVVILAFWLNKYRALGDWKFKKYKSFQWWGNFLKGIFFLKSQNVCFFNSEMYCDNNDLFMILNLFLKMFLFSVWYFLYLNVNACYRNNRLFLLFLYYTRAWFILLIFIHLRSYCYGRKIQDLWTLIKICFLIKGNSTTLLLQ